MSYNYVIIDEPERRGFQIWEDGTDDPNNPVEPTVVVESVVTNSANFIPVDEVRANAEDTIEQLLEQAEMREAAELGLENEKHDPKWDQQAQDEAVEAFLEDTALDNEEMI